jgi:hypothetical protein
MEEIPEVKHCPYCGSRKAKPVYRDDGGFITCDDCRRIFIVEYWRTKRKRPTTKRSK